MYFNDMIFSKGDGRASVLTVLHKLTNNQSLDDLYLEKQKVELQTKISWTRTKWAAKSCDNCHIVEFQDIFCNQTICDLYDKKNNVAHYCDAWHLNKYGAAKIIQRLFNFLNKLFI